ncbi:MAG: nicotinamide mononucleotide deamidase-related protein [Acidilobaceae archaeon]|nr:nicotinamide mononucleotide deamidase-related protein [Acidilobaceae archaeon]MCX8165620.1 nicotinamide mononucleotide deamidase-related protein [Acidilobaceae archaeon]MDW7974047.1 nicotinamide mononucleotide deamidase-related protein [Sulfolobales archaeon]
MEPKLPEAWILSIGNELLIGRTVNTNASWLGKRLTVMGFNVRRIVVVPDDIEEIADEIRRALGRARLIVTTGGLGPTHDDVTLAAVGRALGREMEVNDEALRMLKDHYDRRGLPLTEHRIKMAVMPQGAKILKNSAGSAPGCLLREGETVIVSLPGVPREMEAMFEEVVPLIRQMAPEREAIECASRIRGVPESTLAPLMERLAKERTSSYLKSHPLGFEQGVPVLDVKVLSFGADRQEAEREAREILTQVLKEVETRGGQHFGIHCS